MTQNKIPLDDPSSGLPSECQAQPEPKDSSEVDSRRDFLKTSAASILGAAALMTQSDDAQANIEWAEHFQGNYRLMTEQEKAESRARLEKRYSAEYGKEVTVDGTPAKEGVLLGYALNIRKCIGCRRCVKACVEENNQSRGQKTGETIEWIQVMKMARGEFSKEKMNEGYPEGLGIQVGGNAYSPAGVVLEGEYFYEPKAVPEKESTYMPIACMQCEKPPCVKVCPVRTTYREPDGVVVIDYNWCIGCRMCANACPYWARKFNWRNPQLPPDKINPKTHYLSNRPREKGVMEKCTFCLQRTRKGENPACHAACPTGARVFGNLLDPKSEIRYVLQNKRVFRLKEDLNTQPKFWYYAD